MSLASIELQRVAREKWTREGEDVPEWELWEGGADSMVLWMDSTARYGERVQFSFDVPAGALAQGESRAWLTATYAPADPERTFRASVTFVLGRAFTDGLRVRWRSVEPPNIERLDRPTE